MKDSTLDTSRTLRIISIEFADQRSRGRPLRNGSSQFTTKWEWRETSRTQRDTSMKVADQCFGGFSVVAVTLGQQACASSSQFTLNSGATYGWSRLRRSQG